MLHYRQATLTDIPVLAKLNQQLIQDEGHRNPMTLLELETRMHHWIEGHYEAWLFEVDQVIVAYVLHRFDPEYIYLRQFFVRREYREQGLGRRAIKLLQTKIWPVNARVRLEVLVENEAARAFWKSVGFSEYSITMELQSFNSG